MQVFTDRISKFSSVICDLDFHTTMSTDHLNQDTCFSCVVFVVLLVYLVHTLYTNRANVCPVLFGIASASGHLLK